MDRKFAVLLQWRVRRGKAKEFIAAWEEVNRGLMEQGCYGSTLFEGGNGSFYALARWPDATTRAAAISDFRSEATLLALAEAMEEFEEPVEMVERTSIWAGPGDE